VSVLASRSGVAILDTDRIVGGSIKVKSEWDKARFTEEGDFIDREWVLRVKPTVPLDVVVGIEVTDRDFIIKRQRVEVWAEGAPFDENIKLERVQVVNNGQLTAGQLDFGGDIVYYLGPPPAPETVVFSIPVADCAAGP
jgi:hypothetical protein